jgi:hypothetical protein
VVKFVHQGDAVNRGRCESTNDLVGLCGRLGLAM